MRQRTLQERYDGLNRTVPVTATVPVQMLVKLEGLASQLGLTPEQAAGEAIGQWVVRREQSLNRQARMTVEQAMREAMDKQPIEELLERFRRQMRACGVGPLRSPPQIQPRPLTQPRESSNVPDMEPVSRRRSRIEPDEIQATVKMPIEVHKAFRALAERENRTLAGQLRHAIDKMLAEERLAA